jgi:hypothetical protein
MDSRLVVRADALFEFALGLVLVAGAASGGLGASDFPTPVGAAVLILVGALLLLLGVVLWRGWVGVAALAIGNLATALAAVVWLAGGSGFSSAGAAVVLVAAAGLVVLGAAQVATLRA